MKSVHIPDDVYERAAELAERDSVSVDKLVSALLLEHAREWSHLRARAGSGSVERLKAVLAKVSESEPEAFDRL